MLTTALLIVIRGGGLLRLAGFSYADMCIAERVTSRLAREKVARGAVRCEGYVYDASGRVVARHAFRSAG